VVAFMVKDFGGEIPRKEPRLLPDNMATRATNCDLAAGPLDGLPQPEPVITLTAPWPIRKAYRLPGPFAGKADVWLPLPSEFSSVCRSPLANDTDHRIYWTNPPGSPDAGAWWNTYIRLEAGGTGINAHWSMGFIAPSPGVKLAVSVSGGSSPGQIVYGADVSARGTGYVPNTRLILQGGTLVPGQSVFSVRIAHTVTVDQHIVAGGSGGTDGPVVVSGTTGSGSVVRLNGTISGGALVSLDSVNAFGVYATNPTNLASEPVTGGGLVGAAINLTMGVWDLDQPTYATYTTVPSWPAGTTCTGPGTGCQLNVVSNPNGNPPLVERSYCFTYVDTYGDESSPSDPSDVVAGPTDGTWTITGIPATAPASPAGKNYPPPVKVRLYRTITGETLGAQFYFVADLIIGTTSFVDTIPDTTVVNNNTLASVSWAPPVDGLDGLTSMPGGMLVGFTESTVHFCEPDRPHAWPAGYDQSLIYPIQALAVWQQSLIVLTSGYPSTGSGNSPAQFVFAQVQTPEPCIARGSVVTDLAGVYYASPNGLVALNYFGAQNQTLSNLTREIWQKRFQAAQIIACRHRAQYLAVNGTGMGFLIDYTEQRMGICALSPFVAVISVWNDVYNGDAYMMGGDSTVYRWDSMNTPSLIYRWRSREFYMAAPVSLGACQISCDPAVEAPAPHDVVPPPASGMDSLVLPPGINALFRLFCGPSQQLVHEQWLQQTRSIFRFPSGRKAFNWQFEIIARVPIHSVELASTMRELKGV
jgi:hypothetical protein